MTFQQLIEVANGRIFLGDRDLMIIADLAKMLFQYHASDCPGWSQKFGFQKLSGCVDFAVKEISLNQLAYFKQRAVESAFDGLQDRQLLLELRQCSRSINNNVRAPATSHPQALHIVLNYVGSIFHLLSIFCFFVERDKIVNSVW